MKRLVLAFALCALACGEAPPPPESANKPAPAPAPGPPQLKVAPETVPIEEWIDVDIPVDLKTGNGMTIRKGKYLVCAVKRRDGATMSVDQLLIGTTPGKADFTVPTSGYTVLPDVSPASIAALRGGGGKATLWIRIAGSNGEWGSASFDVDPKWTGT